MRVIPLLVVLCAACECIPLDPGGSSGGGEGGGEVDFQVVGSTVIFREKPDKVLIDYDGTTFKADIDRDGFAEFESTETVTAAGLQRQVLTTYSPANKMVTHRLTLTPGPTGFMHHKDEVLVSGALKTREWDAPNFQKQLGSPTCMLNPSKGTVPCPDVAAIKKKIEDAITEGAKCMQGVDKAAPRSRGRSSAARCGRESASRSPAPTA